MASKAVLENQILESGSALEQNAAVGRAHIAKLTVGKRKQPLVARGGGRRVIMPCELVFPGCGGCVQRQFPAAAKTGGGMVNEANLGLLAVDNLKTNHAVGEIAFR